MTQPNTTPDIDQLMAFENGELNQDEIVELFQRLVDTGLAWKLQGFYGRTARALINEGLVNDRGQLSPTTEEAS